MSIPRKYPPIETLERIKKWCDLQERAHSEVRRKLQSWGLYPSESEQVITELISVGFLNEERYARAFARGRFRLKKWGWKKIENELKRKGVSKYSIARAEEEILREDVLTTLKEIIDKKMATVKAKNEWEKRQKVLRFAVGKGYGWEDVVAVLGN